MIVVSTQTDPMQTWRSEGTHFAVQELSVSSKGVLRFRIETPDDTPTLVDGDNVRVVDGTIPSKWTLLQRPDSRSYVLGPDEWHEPGFWERWMDKDPEARATYEAFRSTLDS